MATAGIFISLEGGEGCGKSTQIRLMEEWFLQKGKKVLCTREPGGTAVGEQVRQILQYSKESDAMFPEAELLLFTASRAQLVREVIVPALATGTVVLSDRFLDSTTVYQGAARKLSPEQVQAINHFAIGACLPDLTLLLDLEVPTAFSRMSERGGPQDRMEGLPLEFHQAVRQGYLDLAANQPARVVKIDAANLPDLVFASIRTILEERFHGVFTN